MKPTAQLKPTVQQLPLLFAVLCSFIAAMNGDLIAAPIHDAAANGDLTELQKLLEMTPKAIEERDTNKMTPLMLAARDGKTEAVRVLLKNGASVSAEYAKGGTPLYLACCNNRPEIVGLLLEGGGDPLAADEQEWSPVRRAAQEGHKEVLAILEAKGVKIDPSWIKPEAPASSNSPFVNSLEMRFVTVPITGGATSGQHVLFSVWETRRKDYEAFATANKGANDRWRNAKVYGRSTSHEPNHPVACVSWEDAQAFCAWLTEKERSEGKIEKNMLYRLPSDHEWSCAVGIGDREDAKASPKDKDETIAGVYPWGSEWPPPERAGNYADVIWNREFGGDYEGINGYIDGFVTTAPVGSFAIHERNPFGLLDLGGNVWEWCEDFYEAPQKECRVLRGGSFDGRRGKDSLLSSNRNKCSPRRRYPNYGFRCVLAPTARKNARKSDTIAGYENSLGVGSQSLYESERKRTQGAALIPEERQVTSASALEQEARLGIDALKLQVLSQQLIAAFEVKDAEASEAAYIDCVKNLQLVATLAKGEDARASECALLLLAIRKATEAVPTEHREWWELELHRIINSIYYDRVFQELGKLDAVSISGWRRLEKTYYLEGSPFTTQTVGGETAILSLQFSKRRKPLAFDCRTEFSPSFPERSSSGEPIRPDLWHADVVKGIQLADDGDSQDYPSLQDYVFAGICGILSKDALVWIAMNPSTPRGLWPRCLPYIRSQDQLTELVLYLDENWERDPRIVIHSHIRSEEHLKNIALTHNIEQETALAALSSINDIQFIKRLAADERYPNQHLALRRLRW